LAGNTMYTVFVPTGAVKDANGYVLGSDYSFKFTTKT